jgi:hypothetical protein
MARCQPHNNDNTDDAKGIYGLSCTLAADRMLRHQTLNDLICMLVKMLEFLQRKKHLKCHELMVEVLMF